MIIAVDFDGTIVEHYFPRIGPTVPGAIEWLKTWKNAGAKLILWTMRSGEYLDAAADYCENAGISFDKHNQGIDDREWTASPKAYAQVYVDDAAFGCPLIHSRSGRPMVNWSIVGPAVHAMILSS